MAGKIKIANDLRPEKRDDIGTNGEFEAGENFLGHRRSAEHVAALQHQDLLAGTREIGGVGQPVMAAADHDYVVFGFGAVY